MASRPPNPRTRRRKWQEEPLVSKEESNDDLYTPSSSDSEYSIDEEEAESDESEEGAVRETPPENSPAPPPDKPPRPASSGRKKEREFPLLWEKWEKENDIWIANKLNSGDEVSAFEGNGTSEIVDPSPDIKLPLMRFQKEGLAWALKQECSVFRGGILADEMGMGKTIQAISLVLTARSLGSQHAWSGLDLNVPCSSSVLPDTKCTLVICPVVAVIQWVGEINKHTEKGSVKVLVYHGANRDKTKYEFDDYDFVITTYSTIESEFRKYLMPPKEMCKYCRKRFYPKKMRTHLKYFCGPYARKTEKQARQVSRKKDGKLKGKKKTVYETKKHDASEKKVQSSDKKILGSSPGNSILHSVKWQRIILDEAHFIKDRHCNTAKAVFALESFYKWALSGTPLQNRVGELYSLVRFLQIWPYSLYFCKDCDCKILDYGSSRDCVDCPHSRVRHFCWWNRFIANPIQSEQRNNFKAMLSPGKRAMALLRERILKSIVLRRTKESRASDLALPPRIVYLRRDSLDTKEQEFYEALYTQSRLQFDAYADAGTLLNNYAHIFDLLTRLRQAVDHPYLVLYSKTLEVANPSKDGIMKQNCGICHQPLEDMVVTSCEHVFCKVCLIDYSASLENVKCPLCSKPLTVDLTTKNPGEQIPPAAIKGYKSGILSRLKDIGTFCTSTKIDALKEEIRDMVELDGSAKGIVFSQYTSFLDLIRFSLEKSGVKCVQLVGSMSLVERDRAITSFTNDSDCKIFLMSLKAGGVALNLTVASHVFLMDPWWNPAVECQAQDRIHRIGQYKPIRIVRFVIENTIEERILRLQEKKELMFQGTIGHNPDAIAKLTEEDLRFLFQV
ncbi:DNA repair protein RAD16-like [Zingiber officinale]|uniref:DNA repair protein RAD16-like n=1 Tax=Zingiber officinale TaxID=94328 RepID=UPI001C4CE350|nr:DNA repair protein RAD16-like [Zingiber officinale]